MPAKLHRYACGNIGVEDECNPEILCEECAGHRHAKGEEVIWAETPADWEELICVDCGLANRQYWIHQCEMGYI